MPGRVVEEEERLAADGRQLFHTAAAHAQPELDVVQAAEPAERSADGLLASQLHRARRRNVSIHGVEHLHRQLCLLD